MATTVFFFLCATVERGTCRLRISVDGSVDRFLVPVDRRACALRSPVGWDCYIICDDYIFFIKVIAITIRGRSSKKKQDEEAGDGRSQEEAG